MEVLSKQIQTLKYKYLMQATEQPWFPIKGRPGMVLEVVNTSIYNVADADATELYVMVKRKGVIHRIDYQAILATITVFRSDSSVYLAPNDEYGFAIIGDTVNDVIEFSVTYVEWSDKEILTARGML